MPDWVLKLMGKGKTMTLEARRGGLRTRTEKGRRVPIRVKHVCEGCNEGWMSTLEDRTRPVLTPLIHGEPGSLDQDAQGLISAWAVKTAMVFECTRVNAEKFYEPRERMALRERAVLPTGTGVWLACRLNGSGIFVDAHFLTGTNKPGTRAFHGYCSTFSMGHFVVQVLTPRLMGKPPPRSSLKIACNPGPWDAATRQIWPVITPSREWPPPLGLGDEGFFSLTHRWGCP